MFLVRSTKVIKKFIHASPVSPLQIQVNQVSATWKRYVSRETDEEEKELPVDCFKND